MDPTFTKIPEKLETDRLVLTRFRHEDAEEIFYTYASKPESTRFVTWSTHQSIRDTREYVARTIAGWNRGIDFSYAIRLKINGRLMGGCGFLNEGGKIQIGYVLGPLHWHQGYATEAARKIVSVLKAQSDFFRIGSFIDADNQASANVLKKVGLVEEAYLKKWLRFPNQNNEPKDCILYKLP